MSHTKVFAIALTITLIGFGAWAACTNPPNNCCTAATTYGNQVCGNTPTSISVTATTGSSSGELTCNIQFDWAYHLGGCGFTDRDVRFCVQVREGTAGSCADNVAATDCDIRSVSYSGVDEDFPFSGLNPGDCYYCVISAEDVEGTGCTCSDCGEGCGTALAGGKSECAEAGS